MVQHCGPMVLEGCWLDVGCGSGGISAGIARHVHRITGVDPEPWFEWKESSERQANLTFCVAPFDSGKLPIEAGSYDVVVCNQVYEHVSDPRQLMKNIHQSLRAGGVCYFAGPNLLWPIEPHVFLPFVHWLPRATAHKLMRALGSSRSHELDAFSAPSWILIQWFREAGFSIENALAGRIIAELELRGAHRRVAQVAANVPNGVWKAMLPIAPGFVFVLRK